MEDLSQPSHPPGPPDTSTQIPKGPLPQLPTQSSAKPTDSAAQPSLAGINTIYSQTLEAPDSPGSTHTSTPTC